MGQRLLCTLDDDERVSSGFCLELRSAAQNKVVRSNAQVILLNSFSSSSTRNARDEISALSVTKSHTYSTSDKPAPPSRADLRSPCNLIHEAQSSTLRGLAETCWRFPSKLRHPLDREKSVDISLVIEARRAAARVKVRGAIRGALFPSFKVVRQAIDEG